MSRTSTLKTETRAPRIGGGVYSCVWTELEGPTAVTGATYGLEVRTILSQCRRALVGERVDHRNTFDLAASPGRFPARSAPPDPRGIGRRRLTTRCSAGGADPHRCRTSKCSVIKRSNLSRGRDISCPGSLRSGPRYVSSRTFGRALEGSPPCRPSPWWRTCLGISWCGDRGLHADESRGPGHWPVAGGLGASFEARCTDYQRSGHGSKEAAQQKVGGKRIRSVVGA